MFEGHMVKREIRCNKLYIWKGDTLPPNYGNIASIMKTQSSLTQDIKVKFSNNFLNLQQANEKTNINDSVNVRLKKDFPTLGMNTYYLSDNPTFMSKVTAVVYKEKIIYLSYIVLNSTKKENKKLISVCINNKEVFCRYQKGKL